MPIINLLDFGNADTMFLKNPSNLRINGETSQVVEAETCHLTWNAAEVDPPQDITYYVNIGQAQKTTANLYWDLVNPSQYTTSTYIDVYARTDDGTQSGTTNGVAFNYKPAISVSTPTGLTVNGSSSSSTGDSCYLSWNASTVEPSGYTITYRIFLNGAFPAYTTTTNTYYSFSESEISNWTTTKSIKIDAYTTDGDGNTISCPGYSNTVSFTYELSNYNLLLTRSLGFGGYQTNASVVNSSDLQVGKATESAHWAVFMRFPAPKDWNKVKTITLHVYRNAGSASGAADFGAPSTTWNDAGTNMSYNSIYYLSSSNTTTKTVSAASSWNTIDLSSIKSILQQNQQTDSSGNFIVISMISKGTYMKINAAPGETYSSYVEITV